MKLNAWVLITLILTTIASCTSITEQEMEDRIISRLSGSEIEIKLRDGTRCVLVYDGRKMGMSCDWRGKK